MARSGRLHAVIMAGGAGERFWPASRQKRPKFFLRVADGRTLLDATAARARRFAAKDAFWVVCGAEHVRAVRAATGLPAARVLVEPERRNTAMACVFAAARIAAAEPDAVLAMLPADHVIPDGRAFAAAMRRAEKAAREAGVLVTLGVKPTRPDPGLGYIEVGEATDHAGLHRVRRFVEKPDEKTARRYLRRGGFLWNAGIFAWSARTILDEVESHAPGLHQVVSKLGGRRPAGREVAAAYRSAPSEPIDTAILEKSRRVWTLPVDFHWSDVGTWESLAQEIGVSAGRSRSVAGELAFDEPGGNLVWSEGKVVALLGVEGLAVIDTEDALLVTRLEDSPGLKRVVAALKAKGRPDVT